MLNDNKEKYPVRPFFLLVYKIYLKQVKVKGMVLCYTNYVLFVLKIPFSFSPIIDIFLLSG